MRKGITQGEAMLTATDPTAFQGASSTGSHSKPNILTLNLDPLNLETPGVTLDGEPLVGNWTMFPIPLGSLPAGLPFTSHTPNDGIEWREQAIFSEGEFLPTFFKGWIDIAGPVHDTFLSTRGWGHGYAFINGVNIGR